jgi:hypothetical protein
MSLSVNSALNPRLDRHCSDFLSALSTSSVAPSSPGDEVVLTKAIAEFRISDSEIALNAGRGLSFCATAILFISNVDSSVNNSEMMCDINFMTISKLQL